MQIISSKPYAEKKTVLSALTDNNPELQYLHSLILGRHDTGQQLAQLVMQRDTPSFSAETIIIVMCNNNFQSERRRNCAISFEAPRKWPNYLSVLVEAEDMGPWTGTTEEPSSRTR